jgi:hypothetical protein
MVVECVPGPREKLWLEGGRKVIINLLLYLATGNCLMCNAVIHWFYRFQDANKMLGKKKEYWLYGNNEKLKRQIYTERNRERHVLRFGTR